MPPIRSRPLFREPAYLILAAMFVLMGAFAFRDWYRSGAGRELVIALLFLPASGLWLLGAVRGRPRWRDAGPPGDDEA